MINLDVVFMNYEWKRKRMPIVEMLWNKQKIISVCNVQPTTASNDDDGDGR